MKSIIIQYRDNKDSLDWKQSHFDWTVSDLGWLNHLVGYAKYRTKVVG